MKKWRFIPKITFHNYNSWNIGEDCFTKWFSINRYWGGQIIYINVKKFGLELDFRYDWLSDMTNGVVKSK